MRDRDGHEALASAIGRRRSWVKVSMVMALVATLPLAACGSSSAATSPSVPASVPLTSPGPVSTAGPLGSDRSVDTPIATIRVPADWEVLRGTLNPSGNETWVYLAPASLPGDCTDTDPGGVCHPWPVVRLEPGGFVVAVRTSGMPGSRPPIGGDPVTVGGVAGTRLVEDADEACVAIGGSTLIRVVLPEIPRTGWSSIDTCIAGPDLAAAESALDSILASVSVARDVGG